jgi:hypothetical protein
MSIRICFWRTTTRTIVRKLLSRFDLYSSTHFSIVHSPPCANVHLQGVEKCARVTPCARVCLHDVFVAVRLT